MGRPWPPVGTGTSRRQGATRLLSDVRNRLNELNNRFDRTDQEPGDFQFVIQRQTFTVSLHTHPLPSQPTRRLSCRLPGPADPVRTRIGRSFGQVQGFTDSFYLRKSRQCLSSGWRATATQAPPSRWLEMSQLISPEATGLVDKFEIPSLVVSVRYTGDDRPAA